MTARYRVVFSEDAWVDLDELAIRIAQDRGPVIAERYCARLQAFCQGLCTFPSRGALRSDVEFDQRVIGFERRVSIYFHIVGDQVVVDRLLYAGRQP